MVLTLAVLLALGAGVALGGHPLKLARLNMKGWPLLFLAVGLQAYLAGHPAEGVLGPMSLRGWGFVASHALVLAVALANWRLPGLKVASLGAALNLVALLANGGLMPVSPEARVAIGHQAAADSLALGTAIMGSKGVVLSADQANLWFLTDIFLLPPPFPIPAVFSVGDLAVAIGVGYLILHTMCNRESYSYGL